MKIGLPSTPGGRGGRSGTKVCVNSNVNNAEILGNWNAQFARVACQTGPALQAESFLIFLLILELLFSYWLVQPTTWQCDLLVVI